MALPCITGQSPRRLTVLLYSGLVIALSTGLAHCTNPPARQVHRPWQKRQLALPPVIHDWQEPPRVTSLALHPPVSVPVRLPAAGDEVPDIASPMFRLYSYADGLPTQSIICSTTDSEGYLWLGTAGAGLCRYDGNRLITFSIAHGLPASVILSLIPDHAGNLWIGTTAGVSKYDGYRFTTFSVADGLAGNFVNSITEDSAHRVWFGTEEGGVSRFDGKRFTSFSRAQDLPDDYIQCLLTDTAGRVWIVQQEVVSAGLMAQPLQIMVALQG